ncbi:hypothetical protein OM076_35935 [Solirubrobacter ginsenosidimutans]|uniref:Uncharacterized protein n=1 Tax=Solirubrobacter ginsenosidimutans TaxID=490573 RepID=A0A9X3MZG9_9ACTN|nr:hypothetical protein [Solirubrobacter ginsenosidimutans]MDA0165714.1 hypothetical protein [Solirubrobacter ginsenosidimutans]
MLSRPLPLLVLLALLVLSGRAWGSEAPPLRLGGGSSCLAATGVPGELVTLGERDEAQLMQAAVAGFTRGERVPLMAGRSCPAVAARPNGAAVAAAVDADGYLMVVVRDPGGSWSEAQNLGSFDGEPTVSVSDRGDGLVAWWAGDGTGARRLQVARRSPSGGFGAAEALGAATEYAYALSAGFSGDGEAFVLWATADRARVPVQVPVQIATAAPGAPFTSTSLGTIAWRGRAALSVAPDGRALVALPAKGALLVAERAPGAPFGAPVPLTTAVDPVAYQVEVASDSGGRAAIGWTGNSDGSLRMATRTAPGAFGAPVAVDPPRPYTGDPFYASEWVALLGDVGPGFFGDAQDLALTPDGRVVFTREYRRTLGGIPTRSVRTATMALAGGAAQTTLAGGAFADIRNPLALVLADGRPAVVWAEDLPDVDFRLHLAADGAAPGPQPPSPAVHLRAAADALTPDGDVNLAVTCSGPCFVRAHVLVTDAAGEGALLLDRAGRGRLNIIGGQRAATLGRPGPVRVRISYGAPNALKLRQRTVRLNLDLRAAPPDPRVVGLRAVRRGDRIRVSWHTNRRPLRTVFWVTGAARPGAAVEPLSVHKVERDGQRAFAVTLTHADAIRYVSLRAQHAYTGHDAKRIELRVP